MRTQRATRKSVAEIGSPMLATASGPSASPPLRSHFPKALRIGRIEFATAGRYSSGHLEITLGGAAFGSWAPAHFPTPLRAGANDCFDENRRSHAEGGTARRNETSAPTGHREGNQGRVRITATDRTRKIRRKADRAFRGPKRGYQHEYCGNIAIRTHWRQVAEAIARQPKSNLSPALATTYSRTVRSAPHPPDGRARPQASAVLLRLSSSSSFHGSSSSFQHPVDARPADAERLGGG